MGRGRPATPPGTHGKVDIWQESPGKWKAFTRLRLYDGRTVTVRATSTGKGKVGNLLEERCKERLGTFTAGTLRPESKLKDLLTTWLEQHDVSERSKRIYTTNMDNHIIPAIGELRLNELNPQILQVFIGKKAPGVAPTCRAVLSSALDYAVRIGVLEITPWRAIVLPKGEVTEVEVLTEDEQKAYIAAVKRWCAGFNVDQPKDAKKPAGRRGRGGGADKVVRIIAGSGLRTSEALGLRIQDVDPKNRRITVCGQSTSDGSRTKVLKNETSRFSHRVISITQDAADAIQEQLDDELVQFWGEPLFPSRSGTYRTANNLNRDLRDATVRLREELKRDIVPKNFRSTIGSYIRDRYGVDAAQLHLGHSTNQVTQQYYLGAPEVVDDYLGGSK